MAEPGTTEHDRGSQVGAAGTPGPRRLRVLVSAYACHPDMGSEPGMGWNWVVHLARHHDLWVLTEEQRYATAMRARLAQHPELSGHIQVEGVPRRRLGEWLWPRFFYYLTYKRWHAEAFRRAKSLHTALHFDLVHQLNMIGYREPGYLWRLQVPIVWGPIGGHAQMPLRFLGSLGPRGFLEYGLRNILNWIQMRASPRVRRAMRRADALVAATPEDLESIRRLHGVSARLIGEVGALDVPVRARDRRRRGDPLRVLWCGVFQARKALPLALRAVSAVISHTPVELHIAGAGAEERPWKTLARRLGVETRCRWYGALPHAEVQRLMQHCDVLLFTSLQDATATVVMEALQVGLPVVCHDAGGFGVVVDDSCGQKIPLVSPRRSVMGFADALAGLASDPERLQALGVGARARSKAFSWEAKTEAMCEVYVEALATYSGRTRMPGGM